MPHYRPNTFAQTTSRSNFPLAAKRRTIHIRPELDQNEVSSGPLGRIRESQLEPNDMQSGKNECDSHGS
jgi:hypothetical protein